jgi:hypothetical protein
VTSKFNELVYQYPIRIPERYSLVIRSLLTQEGICLTLKPAFHFLEVAYPYTARRLLADASLRDRLFQVRGGALTGALGCWGLAGGVLTGGGGGHRFCHGAAPC